MISYQQLERHYDLTRERKIVSRPSLKVIQTVRRGQPIDERAKYDQVVIKTVRALSIRMNNPLTMIDDIGGIMNGILAYYRSQSDLTVNIEGVCLVPSEGFEEKNKLFLDQIIVCLLYTSDAADDLLCVDLGGRRII
eukprot:TRINITY_DN13372_c0_g2_i1.p1 TRINITY_DN13372_c0_g2~~TRINITY_DN13372_c0_g2_i1.p1  ORF type:complete len:137 (+),score=36.20 TRINITY_DN13372_c0_g2_i1:61-471(+)